MIESMKVFLFLFVVLFSYASQAQTKIIEGQYSSGDVIYTWEDGKLRKGQYSSGDILFQIEGELPIEILIFILLNRF